MIAPFIPFFLVSLVADKTWKHGPEYVFEFQTNITATPVSGEGVEQRNRTTVNLFCQPKALDSLSCRLDHKKLRSVDSTSNNEVYVSVPEKDIKLSKDPFEVKFNSRGVEHLLVTETTHTYHLNNIKSVVELLNVGADLEGKPDGHFEAQENSTIGRCNVTFGITRYPPGEELMLETPLFELRMKPPLFKVRGEKIVIEKKRNLNNCSYASFYYGSYGKNTVVESSLPSHLMTSESRIFASDTQFTSSVFKTVTIGSFDKKNDVAMKESTTLTLMDIRPAAKEVPEISKPARTSITANSDLE